MTAADQVTGALPHRRAVDADLLDVLALERIEEDIFRGGLVFEEEGASLYGGQVAAQALRAAGLTVDQERIPHSLHGYFLRGGDTTIPTVFTVFRDRDGRSFSARRVVAVQRGEVIFNMATSFHRPEASPTTQADEMPQVPSPEGLRPFGFTRAFSIEGRVPDRPYPSAPWPTRFWARSTVRLPDDPLLHACALTYISDASSGVLPSADGTAAAGSSIDHAVYFHEPADMNTWLLLDYHARRTGGGRGWYTASVFRPDGVLVGSVAQEALYRTRRHATG